MVGIEIAGYRKRMKAADFSAENGHGKRPALANGSELPLLLLLFCIPPLIGMARHPFWLDEVFTLFPAPNDDSSLRAAFASAFHFSGSVQFTPLHTFLVAIWARIVPSTEFALRCMNFPFLIGIALISRALLRRLALRSVASYWLFLTFIALSPFYLYYSYRSAPLRVTDLLWRNDIPWPALVERVAKERAMADCHGIFSSFPDPTEVILLSPISVASVISRGWHDPRRAARMWTAPGLIGTLATGAGSFYHHAVRSGGGMQFWGGGGFVKSIGFVLYEFMGFAVLGPTRSQLRALAPPAGVESALAPVQLSWMDGLLAVVLAILWGVLAGLVLYSLVRGGTRRFWAVPVLRWSAILFFVGLLLLTVFFDLINYRFQARHASFLYLPFLFLVFACVGTSQRKTDDSPPFSRFARSHGTVVGSSAARPGLHAGRSPRIACSLAAIQRNRWAG